MIFLRSWEGWSISRNFLCYKRAVVTIVNIYSAGQCITVAGKLAKTAGRIRVIIAVPGEPGGCPGFPDNHLLVQLTLVEDIPDMHRDVFFDFTEQLRHMVQRQPDRVVLQSNVDPARPFRRLINEYFVVRQPLLPFIYS